MQVQISVSRNAFQVYYLKYTLNMNLNSLIEIHRFEMFEQILFAEALLKSENHFSRRIRFIRYIMNNEVGMRQNLKNYQHSDLIIFPFYIFWFLTR